MSSRQIEILAPAGSYECFRAALLAGADAVYAGGARFGARAYADNFTEDELIRAIEEAHLFGKRLYLTVNTLLKDKEMEELYSYLGTLYEKGLDAVIVQDAGVLEYIRKTFPRLELHASTQMTVTGFPGASFLEQNGVKRVVPARELSLQEIREIREHTDMEIECFVHGALCYCYSGQCLLSSMIGGRSGNRGQCAQPCRLPWTVNGRQRYYMSLKDMCTLELIPDLAEAGVDSFKIEGRMKKPEYVAAVTAMYRKYTDLWLEKGRKGYHIQPADKEILLDLYNRGGFRTGYYKQHNGTDMLCLDRPNHAGVPAVRTDSGRGRRIEGTALTDLGRGDVLEIGSGKKDNYTMGQEVKKGEKISFLLPKGVKAEKGTIFPRVRNERLIQSLRQSVLEKQPRKKAAGELTLICGQPALLTVESSGFSCAVQSQNNVQAAENRPLDKEQIRNRLLKTGATDFFFETLEIHMEGEVFLPMQELNQMRRDALNQLRQKIISSFYRPFDPELHTGEEQMPESKSGTEAVGGSPDGREKRSRTNRSCGMPPLAVLAANRGQLVSVQRYLEGHPSSRIHRVYVDCHMNSSLFTDSRTAETAGKIRALGKEVYAVMPYVLRRNDRLRFEKDEKAIMDLSIDGMMVRSYDEVSLLKKCGFDKNIILDHNLYVFNRYAKEFWKAHGITEFTAPAELNDEELENLGLDCTELIVYGYLPLMVSAQCIASAVSGCRKKSGLTYVEDRYRSRYPVNNNCDSCYSIIYSPQPVYLGNQQERIRQIAPKRLRIQFSVEDEKRIPEILSLFEKTGGEAASRRKAEFSFTQGHFNRGII